MLYVNKLVEDLNTSIPDHLLNPANISPFEYLGRVLDATLSGNLFNVAIALEDVRDVNETNLDGTTLLNHAIIHGDPEIVLYLINQGANFDMPDRQGVRPLNLAIRAGNLALTEMLIDLGADLNVPDFAGYTPLHVAVLSRLPSIVERLLEGGARLDITNATGETPLDLARIYDLSEMVNLLNNI